jgi:hypothetical protein
MRGKYITTNIRLAARSGSKKIKTTEVKERAASIENYAPIWTKPAGENKIEKASLSYLAQAV